MRALLLRDRVSGNDGQIDRRTDGSFYFRCRSGLMDGRRFHCYDVRAAAGRVKRVPFESLAATHRVFVMAGGDRFVYPFAKGERRTLSSHALERQLAKGTYEPGERKNAGNPR